MILYLWLISIVIGKLMEERYSALFLWKRLETRPFAVFLFNDFVDTRRIGFARVMIGFPCLGYVFAASVYGNHTGKELCILEMAE